MSVLAVGLSHHSAPLAIRERLAFGGEQRAAALPALRQALGAEAAILSTCNRTELYLSGAPWQRAADWLAKAHGMEPRQLTPHLYALPGDQAVRHAFRVASGLDSMVLGEPQILGQMKDAARAAQDAGTLGSVLHRLFQRSFSVAKEVRASTSLGAGSVSLAAAAVKLAGRIFPSVRGLGVLLVGAGEMIELCATHFAAQSPARMTVANRSADRAAALAGSHRGEAIALRDLPERLYEHDVVISCTASSLPLIGKGMVERAMAARRRRPMLMVDLAVPRDIEPEAGAVDGVFLYSLDDLRTLVDEGRERRHASVEQAEAIVDGQVGEFMHWLTGRSRAPLIRTLREDAEQVRLQEMDRALRRLARGEPAAEVLESLSRGLSNKLLHAPTRALHDVEGEPARELGTALLSAARRAPARRG